MPSRKTILANGEYYHIFNRGTDKKTIFTGGNEFKRFIDLLQFYQYQKSVRFSYLSKAERDKLIKEKGGEQLVEIICYCLMPNHYHLLLKQLADEGISRFIRVITNSYAKYFNTIHERSGILFQGNFKAVRIEDNDQFLQLSRYIHLNPLAGFVTENIDDWTWSSFHEYTSSQAGICDKTIVLDQFKNKNDYLHFINDNDDYQKDLSSLKDLRLD